jgi:glycine betaine/proline transport system substrate-binding protein
MKMKFLKRIMYMMLSVAVVFSVTACGKDDTGATSDTKGKLILADAGWDSIRFHNEIARLILEEGYGYETDIMPGSTENLFLGQRNGEVDILMEAWQDNIASYEEAIKQGDLVELSSNFDDNMQGIYVPAYVIEGDSERGIEPMAPDLETVGDLMNYTDLFEDPEDPGRSMIVNAPPGWVASEIMKTKIGSYGLDSKYNLSNSGSGSALAASIASAYESGKPWLGYYWEPTWISGKYEMVLLKETPYSEELWNDGYKCGFKAIDVTVVMNSRSAEKYPDVADFLSNYSTSSALTAKGLSYMQKNDASSEEAAKWFMKENMQLWKSWVSEDVAEKVEAALE